MRWQSRILITAPFLSLALCALVASCNSGGSDCAGSFDSQGSFVEGRCPQPGPGVGFTIQEITLCDGPPESPSVTPTPCPGATSTSVAVSSQLQLHAQALLEKKKNNQTRLDDITLGPTTLWTSTEDSILRPPSAGNGGLYTALADGCACVKATSGGIASLPIDVGVFTPPASPPACVPCPTPLATTGAASSPGAEPASNESATGVLEWSYNAKSPLNGPIVSGPDGRAYFITAQQLLYGLDHTGRAILVRPVTGRAPAVAADGTIYAAQGGARLSAFAPDGARLWHIVVGGDAQHLVAADNGLYAAVGDEIVRVGNGGTFQWSTAVEQPVTAASIPSGGIAIGSSSGAVTTLSSSGAVVWTANVPSGIAGEIAATGDSVYAASRSGAVHAFDARTGAQLWRIDAASAITSGPLSGGAGRVVFTADAVYSVSRDATAMLRFDAADARLATPLADGSGRVFVAGDGGYAAMLSSDGIELWTTRSFGEVESAVAAGGGLLFIANTDGRVFAVR